MPDKERKKSMHLPAAAWITFVLIYLVTVPWYLPRDWIDPTLWAFPAWSLVTVGGATALAVFTAYALLRLWPEDGAIDRRHDDEAPR